MHDAIDELFRRNACKLKQSDINNIVGSLMEESEQPAGI